MKMQSKLRDIGGFILFGNAYNKTKKPHKPYAHWLVWGRLNFRIYPE